MVLPKDKNNLKAPLKLTEAIFTAHAWTPDDAEESL